MLKSEIHLITSGIPEIAEWLGDTRRAAREIGEYLVPLHSKQLDERGQE